MPLRLCVFVLAGLLALVSPLQARPLYIVAIGASNTSGLGVGEQNAYPAALERLLRQKGIDAHVTNAGVWGDVTAGMRNRLDSAVPKGTDIVILQPGTAQMKQTTARFSRACARSNYVQCTTFTIEIIE